MTMKKLKRNAFVSALCFGFSLFLWAFAPREPVFEFLFNLNIGISGVLLVGRVLSPFLMTAAYDLFENKYWRGRFEDNYILWKFFIIKREVGDV